MYLLKILFEKDTNKKILNKAIDINLGMFVLNCF